MTTTQTTAAAAEPLFTEADVVHVNTRAQAIADGVLVDVTDTAKEAGFAYPVALTRAVWTECVEWTQDDARRKPRFHQDEAGRLWDVLFVGAFRLKLLRAALRLGEATAEAYVHGLRTKLHEPEPVDPVVFYRLKVVPRPGHGRKQMRVLKLVIGSGDDGLPAITILLPDED